MTVETTLLAIQARSKSRGRTSVAPVITRKTAASDAPAAISRLLAAQGAAKRQVVAPAPVVKPTGAANENERIAAMMAHQQESKKPTASSFSVVAETADYQEFMKALEAGDAEAIKKFGINVDFGPMFFSGTDQGGTAQVSMGSAAEPEATAEEAPAAEAPAEPETVVTEAPAKVTTKKSRKAKQAAEVTNPIGGLVESMQ